MRHVDKPLLGLSELLIASLYYFQLAETSCSVVKVTEEIRLCHCRSLQALHISYFLL